MILFILFTFPNDQRHSKEKLYSERRSHDPPNNNRDCIVQQHKRPSKQTYTQETTSLRKKK